jgi:hypothetical protein
VIWHNIVTNQLVLDEQNKWGINLTFYVENLKGRDKLTHLDVAGEGNIKIDHEKIGCEANDLDTGDLGYCAVEGFCEDAN